jgi:transcriptional regulator with XRE-family HTH domain
MQQKICNIFVAKKNIILICNKIIFTSMSFNSIKYIRERLGFSQQDLADYLQVSRGLLSMVELNQRSLPSKAYIQMSKLILAHQSELDKPLPDELVVKQKNALSLSLQKMQKDLEYHLIKQKMEIEALEESYERLKLQENVFTKLSLEASATNPDDFDSVFFGLRLRITKKKLRKIPLAQLTLAKMKLERLEFELAQVEKYSAEI